MRKGFTLIELLIVIAIIAILAAIAIPQFSKYRIRAYNSAAESDLKNAKTKLEAFYTDYFTYPDAITSASTGNVAITATTPSGASASDTLSLSNGVYCQMNVSGSGGGANDSYVIVTHHIAGDEEYGGDSDASAVYYQKNRSYIGQQIPVAPPNATANTDDLAANGWFIK